MSTEVNNYFLEHWDFQNEKAKKKFLIAEFPRVTCLYFPEAREDRIHLACQLLAILFLIDGTCKNTGLCLILTENRFA